MRPRARRQPLSHRSPIPTEDPAIVIATVARERGITGVHTHVRQLRRYLDRTGGSAELVTPHSWARSGRWWRGPALVPLFGARVVLERVHGPVNVWWYRTLARVLPPLGPASLPRRQGPVRRVRAVPGVRPSGSRRPDGPAPTGGPRGALPDLPGRRVGGQGPDRPGRQGVPVDPANRTVRRPAGRRPRVRVQLGTHRGRGVDAGGRTGEAHRAPQLRQHARATGVPGCPGRPGHHRQPRGRQEPPLPVARAGRGEAGGPHLLARRVRRGRRAGAPPRPHRRAGPGWPGAPPRVPERRAGPAAWVPGVRPRLVLGVVVPRDHGGHGCRSPGAVQLRGRAERALPRPRPGPVLADRRPGGRSGHPRRAHGRRDASWSAPDGRPGRSSAPSTTPTSWRPGCSTSCALPDRRAPRRRD